MSDIITQGARAGDFLLSEANGERSRSEVVISAGAGLLAAGTLIGILTTTNALVASAKAGGNTGNGTVGSSSITSEAITGTYVLTITKAAANGGEFKVVGPNGEATGKGVVGTAKDGGGLTFTLADGSTDFVVGDAFNLAVNAGLGEWIAYDDDGANDGRRAATGILYRNVDARTKDVRAAAIVRDAEVDIDRLVGLDDAGKADLLALGIICR